MKITLVTAPLLVLLLAHPGPAQTDKEGKNTGMGKPAASEYATIGGGCFWCLEAVYERLPGIRAVVSGYAGGTTPDPTYKLVCTGTTGHAEVVRIEYDPSVIGYRKILELFWEAHDPTTLNRQGADIGSQYRSIILYENESQRAAAEQSRAEAGTMFPDPIVTEIVPLKIFTPAEEYHQDYFQKNPNAPYCMLVIQPKLRKLDKGK
jgi:peptide-methionine (S)-S-oxide reductase